MQTFKKQFRRLALPLCLAALPAAVLAGKPAPLPEETIGIERLTPPDGQRLFVADVAFNHMVDGRVHVVDGKDGRYLGQISTGFGPLTTVSADGRSIFVATTYHPRLYRGPRSDVVEVHDAQTLALKAEIDIPAKRAQALSYRSLLAESGDGRFLFVQNATPATSVTVVDLQQGKFVTEVPTPGCWSVQAWPQGRRFSTICGDGTLLTVTLDENGQPVTRERSARFFDPDKDPIYIHPEMKGEERYFVSYYGTVYPVRLAGEAPVFAPAWSLLDARDRKQHWRPGGLQVMALHQASNTLFVNMHDHGEEGSHKNPSKEIWAFDLTQKKRVARIPSNGAVSLTAGQGPEANLYQLNVERGEIVVRRIARHFPKVRTLSGIGETSVFLEVR